LILLDVCFIYGDYLATNTQTHKEKHKEKNKQKYHSYQWEILCPNKTNAVKNRYDNV